MSSSQADERLAQWHRRAAVLLDEALDFLNAHDEAPCSDGVVGEWVRQLEHFRFEERHTAPIIALIGKRDLILREKGVLLARSLLDDVESAMADVDAAVASMLEDSPVDPWILEAVARLLSHHAQRGQFLATYRRIASELGHSHQRRAPAPGRGIMRNRGIDPHRTFITLFEQHILDATTQTERERLVLPFVEAALGTRGFEATRESILRRLNAQ
jgi:hypothetical protein